MCVFHHYKMFFFGSRLDLKSVSIQISYTEI